MLILKIPLVFCLDASHKASKFSNLLSEEGFEFVQNRKNNTVVFNFSLMFFCKKDALGVYSASCIKIVFALLTNVVTLYMQAIVVHVEVLSLKSFISSCGVCFAISWRLTNNFRTNLIDICRFTLIYIPGKPKMRAKG